jgi:hypothetical protein
MTHASSGATLDHDDISARLTMLEGTLTDAVKVLGSMVMIDDLTEAAQNCRDDDGHMPATTSAFDAQVIAAIEDAPDDVIDVLHKGYTGKLLADDMGDRIRSIIRNGSFSVSFESY